MLTGLWLNRWVQTEMGNRGAQSHGMKEAPVMLKDSIDGMLGKVSLPYRLMNVSWIY